MPRVCTICTHPKRSDIDSAILNSESLRNIAKRYAVSDSAVLRHKTNDLPDHLTQSKAIQEASADNLAAELRRLMDRVNLLFDACDRWLRDADNPEQYDVGPRAEDLKVTYLEQVGDVVVKKKKKLSELLPQIERDRDIIIKAVETKYADPRLLLLHASGKLGEHLELLAKLLLKLQEKDPQTNNNYFLTLIQIAQKEGLTSRIGAEAFFEGQPPIEVSPQTNGNGGPP